MKTALQELIEELTLKANFCPTSTGESRARKGAYVDAIMIAKSKLPKSEAEIKEAYTSGGLYVKNESTHEMDILKSSHQYFNNKYGTQ